MTTLNNAFLRAYHRDRPGTAAPPQAPPAESRPPATAVHPTTHAAHSHSAPTHAHPSPVGSPINVSAPTAVAPPPGAGGSPTFLQGLAARTSLPQHHSGPYGSSPPEIAPSAAYPPSSGYHSPASTGTYEPTAPQHRPVYSVAPPASPPAPHAFYAPGPTPPSHLPDHTSLASPTPASYSPPAHAPTSHAPQPHFPAPHPSTSVAPPHFLPPLSHYAPTPPAVAPQTEFPPQARSAPLAPLAPPPPVEQPKPVETAAPALPQKTTPQRAAFAPAWEVDELPWTEACEQMKDCTGRELWRAVERWQSPHGVLPRVIGVTSLIRREGRSTVAASLARSAADSGRRVALLDADLDNPRLSSSLETQIATYWTDCVFHGAALDEAAVHSVSDHLTVFPLGAPDRQSPLDWSAPETLELFHSLRPHFDLIVIDLGPLTEVLRRGLQGGADSPLDGTILLRDVRITGADQVLLIARELHQAGLPIVGVVDNFNESVADEQP